MPLSLALADRVVAYMTGPTADRPVASCVVERPVEVELLERWQAGDDRAMDELVLMYQTQAFWVARHLIGNDEVARDIVQDAFLRLLRRHESYDVTRSSFRAWFLHVVRNLAIDQLRRLKVRRPAPLHEMAAPLSQTSGLEGRETRDRIRVVMAALPEHYRELLIMREVEGISPQDLATITETDYGTTRWRIHQARKLFREEWRRRYGEEQP